MNQPPSRTFVSLHTYLVNNVSIIDDVAIILIGVNNGRIDTSIITKDLSRCEIVFGLEAAKESIISHRSSGG